jgi:hypothetical protein
MVGPLPPSQEQQLDSMLTLYVNIGVALAEASREATRAGALADGAIRSLRRQLSAVAGIIRNDCAEVAAARCEHAASRFRAEVEDALDRAHAEDALLAPASPAD